MADAAKKIDAAEIPEPEKDKLFESGGPSFEGVFGEMKKTVEEDRQAAESLKHDITGTAPALEASYGTDVNPTEAAGLQALGKEVEDAEAELEVVISEIEGLSMREQEEQDFQMGRLLHDIDTEKARPAETVGAPAPEAPKTPETDYSAMSDAELSSLYEKLFDESVADAKAHPEKLKPYKKALKTGILPDDPEADNAEINKVFAEIRARRGGKKQAQPEASAAQAVEAPLPSASAESPAPHVETPAEPTAESRARIEEMGARVDTEMAYEDYETAVSKYDKSFDADRAFVTKLIKKGDEDSMKMADGLTAKMISGFEKQSAEEILANALEAGIISKEEHDAVMKIGKAEDFKKRTLFRLSYRGPKGTNEAKAPEDVVGSHAYLDPSPLDHDFGPSTPLELKMPPAKATELPPLPPDLELGARTNEPLELKMPPAETAEVAPVTPKRQEDELYVDINKIIAEALLEKAKPEAWKLSEGSKGRMTIEKKLDDERMPFRIDIQRHMAALDANSRKDYIDGLRGRRDQVHGDDDAFFNAASTNLGMSRETFNKLSTDDYSKSFMMDAMARFYDDAIRFAEEESARLEAPAQVTPSQIEMLAKKLNSSPEKKKNAAGKKKKP